MAKHILLGDTNANFRLDPSVNADTLSTQLQNGASSGVTIAVSVTTPDSFNMFTVWVNPAQLPWWTIMEFPDADA
ncbi:hypothetical protein ACIP5T_00145 [Microbacterium sp. NPDC088619]|uniref:hypothetical protein n=1 Tax=Microbacterium sp. NPDC088619 TaxID=3364196 RepID=UPI003807EF06